MKNSIYLLFFALAMLLWSCGDSSPSVADSSATEVGNPYFMAKIYSNEDSKLAIGAVAQLAPQKYNPLMSNKELLREEIIDDGGECYFEDVDSGEYLFTVFSRDRREGFITPVAIYKDTVSIIGKTEPLSAVTLKVESSSDSVEVYIPGTSYAKKVAVQNGTLLLDSLPVGTIPAIKEYSSKGEKELVTTFQTISEDTLTLDPSRDWFQVVRSDADMEQYGFSGYDLVTEGSGDLWIAAGTGIYYQTSATNWALYNGLIMDSITPPTFTNIVIDSNDVTWIAGEGKLIRYERGWNFIDANTSSLTNDTITAMAIGPNGTDLWVANKKSIDLYRDGEFRAISPMAAQDPVTGLLSSSDSLIWIVTSTGVICSCNRDGGEWKSYHPSLLQNRACNIFAVAEDSTGRIWFSTSEGILLYRGDGWDTLGTWLVDSDPISDIAVDPKGKVWLLGKRNLYSFDGKEWHSYFGGEQDFYSLHISESTQKGYIGMKTGVISFEW